MRCATMSRAPPAACAPAIPRKIVTSSCSIFCQMRCAVARLRPWKEIRSIRVRSSSAEMPASTVNGSIGVCRKRDFFFMRAQLNHNLEGFADADVRGRAVRDRAGAVVSPRGADGERHRCEVAEDDDARELD